MTFRRRGRRAAAESFAIACLAGAQLPAQASGVPSTFPGPFATFSTTMAAISRIF
jgi:hypothetical protein